MKSQRNNQNTPGTNAIQSRVNDGNALQAQASIPARLNGRANLSGRDLVMLEFQRTSMEMTRSFLESQQRVMLAYFNKPNYIDGSVTSLESSKPTVDTPSYVLPYPQAVAPVYPDNGSAPYSNSISSANQTVEQHALETLIADAQVINARANVVPSEDIGDASTARVSSYESTSSPAVQMKSEQPAGEAGYTSPDQLIEALVGIVSERTGYPPEMLDPNLDLEADLGIDSIKRVEILNSFRRLLPEERQNALEDGIERLAGVKTLQGIMDWIRSELDPNLERKPAGAEPNSIALVQSSEAESGNSAPVASLSSQSGQAI